MSDVLPRQRDVAPRDMAGACPEIVTQRLTLRAHRLDDADAIAQSMGDYQVVRNLARVPVPFHRQDALDWLVIQTSGLAAGWSLAVTQGDAAHIGCVSLDLRHGQWHLGYWLNRFYWGRGFGGEAVHATLERFFRRMPGVTVHSSVFADNASSLRLQKKLGFSITGCRQIYALARAEMVSHIDTSLTAAALQRPGQGGARRNHDNL